MRTDEIMSQPPLWTNAAGKYSEVVISSKIRLARNIEQFKFPSKATQAETAQTFDFIAQHLHYPVFSLSQLSPVDRERLVERLITKREFLINTEGKGIGIWDNESFNIIINDEEHIKIQHVVSGLNLESAYKEIDKVDTEISGFLTYAFSKQFGYLTASPTDTGTALRVSAYLHLPGLVHSEKLKRVVDKLSQLGFSVKSVSGEGTKIEGNFFEITNRTTLGRTEGELIDSLDKTILEIIEHEKEARDILFKNARVQIEDKIWRAYSILKSARMLSMEEFLNLSSAVRLGVGMGMLNTISLKTLNELLIYAQLAHLKRFAINLSASGGQIPHFDTSAEIDSYRATYVRETLAKNQS